MKIFAISDLHLSESDSKTMDVFGEQWEGHFEKIAYDWTRNVSEEDAVLIPGDISWAMHLEEAFYDLKKIADLPGRKVILRGNHDYWWSSISRLRNLLPEGMYAIQNDSLALDGSIVCGSRGWLAPGSPVYSADDDKVYKRELIRMEISLQNGSMRAEGRPVIAMIHYPPVSEKKEGTGFSKLFTKYLVKHVVYGHLHGRGSANAFEGLYDGVMYHHVSCDHTDFRLKLVLEP